MIPIGCKFSEFDIAGGPFEVTGHKISIPLSEAETLSGITSEAVGRARKIMPCKFCQFGIGIPSSARLGKGGQTLYGAIECTPKVLPHIAYN
jgi:hypothetical protein